jgi:hypothetical protein
MPQGGSVNQILPSLHTNTSLGEFSRRACAARPIR